jgi:hypothetical protein
MPFSSPFLFLHHPLYFVQFIQRYRKINLSDAPITSAYRCVSVIDLIVTPFNPKSVKQSSYQFYFLPWDFDPTTSASH